MSDLVGVIPAAGRGTRAYPHTKGIPKAMLEVAGEPNLARVLRIFRDQLEIERIVVVVGRYGDVIRGHFGDGQRFGVSLTYVENDAVDKGLSHSILLTRPFVKEHFVVILGDECYLDSNHEELLATDWRRVLVTCAVVRGGAPEQIAKNYAVEVAGGRVTSIVEKPREPGPGLLGVGTFLFHRDFYGHLEAALASPSGEPSDPVSVLGRLVRAGVPVAPFFLRGRYVNINDRDELNLAAYLARTRDFARHTMALALLARGDVADAQRAVDAWRATERFGDIVVVFPPGQPPAALAGARVVVAPSAGYGDLTRTGLDALDADLLFTAWADASFTPRDVPKFVEYLKDADLVVGTRTTRQLVHQGTNMRGAVRLAHVWLAKLLELVWWSYEPRFTDLGCTFRALWRSTYRLIRPHLETSGPESSVEMLLETIRCRKRVIEIPVSFEVRRKGLHEPDQTLRTALDILALIVRRRIAERTR